MKHIYTCALIVAVVSFGSVNAAEQANALMEKASSVANSVGDLAKETFKNGVQTAKPYVNAAADKVVTVINGAKQKGQEVLNTVENRLKQQASSVKNEESASTEIKETANSIKAFFTGLKEKVFGSDTVTLEGKVSIPGQGTQKVSISWDKNTVLKFGAGAVAVITIGGLVYVLYKNGTIKRVSVEALKNPGKSALVAFAIAATGGAIYAYKKGLTLQDVKNVFVSTKTAQATTVAA